MSEMGKAVLRACDAGSSDDSTSPSSIICTAKHFIGYSAPLSGKDRTDAWVTTLSVFKFIVSSLSV